MGSEGKGSGRSKILGHSNEAGHRDRWSDLAGGRVDDSTCAFLNVYLAMQLKRVCRLL